MHSLARTCILAAALGLGALAAGCGDPEPTLYITQWATPWESMQAGTRQPFAVRLSQKVQQKTYVDIEISGGDQQYVTTDPADYVIIAANSNTHPNPFYIIAKNVPSKVRVELTFRIRDNQESRGFAFDITP